MAFDKKDSGALFINDKKQKDTHPDLTGTLNVGGVDYYLSAWQKTSAKGAQFYSLSAKLKEQSGSAKSGAALLGGKPAGPERFDDEEPF